MPTLTESLDAAGLRSLLASVEQRAGQSADEAADAERDAQAAFAREDTAALEAAWGRRDRALARRATLLGEADSLRAELIARVQPDLDAWAKESAALVAEQRAVVERHSQRVDALLAELDALLDSTPTLFRGWQDQQRAQQSKLDAIRQQAAPAGVDAPPVDWTVPLPDTVPWLLRLDGLARTYARLPQVLRR